MHMKRIYALWEHVPALSGAASGRWEGNGSSLAVDSSTGTGSVVALPASFPLAASPSLPNLPAGSRL